jgi:hypothetical protein
MSASDETMTAVRAMLELRGKLDADLRLAVQERRRHLVSDGPEPDITAEHAIYRVLRGVALLERDGVPSGEVLRQIDTKLRLDVLAPRAQTMPAVEDYMVSLLRKVAPGYLEHGPELLAGAIAVARKALCSLQDVGCWTTPDGRPPPEWSFERMPRERQEFWPLRVPLVPRTRDDVDFTDMVIRRQPGDELWSFSSPPSSWGLMMGTSGIALVRNGRVIADVVTMMN